jgi:serine protease
MPARGASGGSGTTAPLSYHGGASDGAAGIVGVETTPGVYVVFWGSQWTGHDPSGEAAYLHSFLSGLYQSGTAGAASNDNWSPATTQYCQGVASGISTCPSGSAFVTAPGASPLLGSWSDSGTAAPSHPSQSQLANEAIRAAAHFGNSTALKNASVQYVIATAHGNSSRGFGTQYCAWHSSTSSSYGQIAYTNLPYITDAGSSCGANFVGSSNDGISIVAGHEYAEAVTDPFPSTGWDNASGYEIGDLCAWINPGKAGGAFDLTISTGTFAVQSLWSNSFGSQGGCVDYYPVGGSGQSQTPVNGT